MGRFWWCRAVVCCRAYFRGKILGCIWLGDRELVKWCKIFLKKSCRKIWWNGNFGSTFATANGERRFPTAKAAKKVLAVTEKVVTFAEPAAGVAEGGKKTFEMMLQTI